MKHLFLKKISEYVLPRNRLFGVGIIIGVTAGLINLYLDVDFILGPELFGLLFAAVVTVIVLHEGIHGAVATFLGHKPLFGLKPPLVYITFSGKIPKRHFILIALAPFLVLNTVFVFLYAYEKLRLFSDLCLTINTIGAIGDVWIVLKLLSAPKGALIQDTKTGIEVWIAD